MINDSKKQPKLNGHTRKEHITQWNARHNELERGLMTLDDSHLVQYTTNHKPARDTCDPEE